jgi:hypothetical protein
LTLAIGCPCPQLSIFKMALSLQTTLLISLIVIVLLANPAHAFGAGSKSSQTASMDSELTCPFEISPPSLLLKGGISVMETSRIRSSWWLVSRVTNGPP